MSELKVEVKAVSEGVGIQYPPARDVAISDFFKELLNQPELAFYRKDIDYGKVGFYLRDAKPVFYTFGYREDGSHFVKTFDSTMLSETSQGLILRILGIAPSPPKKNANIQPPLPSAPLGGAVPPKGYKRAPKKDKEEEETKTAEVRKPLRRVILDPQKSDQGAFLSELDRVRANLRNVPGKEKEVKTLDAAEKVFGTLRKVEKDYLDRIRVKAIEIGDESEVPDSMKAAIAIMDQYRMDKLLEELDASSAQMEKTLNKMVGANSQRGTLSDELQTANGALQEIRGAMEKNGEGIREAFETSEEVLTNVKKYEEKGSVPRRKVRSGPNEVAGEEERRAGIFSNYVNQMLEEFEKRDKLLNRAKKMSDATVGFGFQASKKAFNENYQKLQGLIKEFRNLPFSATKTQICYEVLKTLGVTLQEESYEGSLSRPMLEKIEKLRDLYSKTLPAAPRQEK